MKYELLGIYENEIRKRMKNKKQVYLFELYKYSYLENIFLIKPCFYSIFLIFEPKVRVIMCLNIKDKIINHYITRYILIPKLEKYLDFRNVATRKNMGTSYARNLVSKYLCKLKKNEFYILKLDISKYFYSINHNVLKSLLKDKLDEEEYKIICNVIDSTNYSYINERITFLENKYKIDLPHYDYGMGLPIGNMTSQFLSIFYLYQLDFKIIHSYKIPCYVRYMDDFILMHQDKEYLKEVYFKIKEELKSIYHLKLNDKKSKITSSRDGFVFLGIHYKIKEKRIIKFLPNGKKVEMKRKIKRKYSLFYKNAISLESLYSSRQCYFYNKVGKGVLRKAIYEQEI